MDLSYILNELGENRSDYYNAIAPPIIQTSNFTFPDVESMRRDMLREFDAHLYTRGNNPTVEILRKKLAALEGAEDALVLASGSAAIAAAVIANVGQGDHIVSVAKPYSWTTRLMMDFLPRFGVTTTFVDGTDVQHFERAIQANTRIIYLESPNTFTFELQDLAAVAALAKARGIVTMVDNSYSTPLYQQPIKLGIDLTMHSASKYIGGHSDLVAGVITGSNEMIRKIFYSEFMTLGGIISPQNAWLMIRGLRTLPLRLERSARSAAKIVAFLEDHPKVKRVYYPFSPTHPQYELARRQMSGCGGLLTIALDTDSLDRVDAFADAFRRFILGVSWGGHESLVFPSGIGYSKETLAPGDTGFTLVRLYIGLEDPYLLIADLRQALEHI
ncbi:aminotransferase class I/II-fold pyridoxal phosphate-dependent enzyme [Larkinella soli]|uniref:aminotransferase class I/II-fold pyridoxal phosphate-dependent enzyme n=1 Tax=Larkinella soli TaxID=1770527 RepID=UPI000FFC625E|nr:aminotransferase class I/II-fold pyridoxal phosphate-dependent enzyme [Larkinella soli]